LLSSREATQRSTGAIVQVADDAFKVSAKAIQEKFVRGGGLQRLFLRYTQALITQVSQTAVCNRLHSMEKRLCRWLLLCHNRVKSNELQMTQEFISNMLGTRRESVTVAAGRLQDERLIHYARGHIKILSSHGLEARSCECYRVVKNESDRLLGPDAELGLAKSAGSRGRRLLEDHQTRPFTALTYVIYCWMEGLDATPGYDRFNWC
jgi:Crp-like helix-turn-helix domain